MKTKCWNVNLRDLLNTKEQKMIHKINDDFTMLMHRLASSSENTQADENNGRKRVREREAINMVEDASAVTHMCTNTTILTHSLTNSHINTGTHSLTHTVNHLIIWMMDGWTDRWMDGWMDVFCLSPVTLLVF